MTVTKSNHVQYFFYIFINDNLSAFRYIGVCIRFYLFVSYYKIILCIVFDYRSQICIFIKKIKIVFLQIFFLKVILQKKIVFKKKQLCCEKYLIIGKKKQTLLKHAIFSTTGECSSKAAIR